MSRSTAEGETHENETPSEGSYFRVSINMSPGRRPDGERDIGPYKKEDLDEFGEPPPEDINDAVWEIIGDFVGLEGILKEEAEM